MIGEEPHGHHEDASESEQQRPRGGESRPAHTRPPMVGRVHGEGVQHRRQQGSRQEELQQPVGWLVPLRRHRARVQRLLGDHQGNLVSVGVQDGDVTDGMLKLNRKEGRLPLGDRPVDRVAEGEQRARIGSEVGCQQPPCVEPERRPRLARFQDLAQAAAQDHVHGVADARRAVVEVVVVGVEAVVREDVPRQEVAQLDALLRRQVQLLGPDRAVHRHVRTQVRFGLEGLGPVQHAALHEAHQEVLLPEAEHPVVVDAIRAAHRIVDPQRIVREALPHGLPRAHRYQIYRELRARRAGLEFAALRVRGAHCAGAEGDGEQGES